MAIETPSVHRLSPSGLFLGPFGNLPLDSLRNVYKGFFPRGPIDGSGQLVPAVSTIAETFGIDLPLVWPNTDPAEAFDPNKLLYLIWVNISAATDFQGATPGPANMVTSITVDADPGPTTPIENIVQDENAPQVFSNFAGSFLGRSAVHRVLNEAIVEIDIVNDTYLAVFRPGTIPLWTTGGAIPWTAGSTRHIYVEVQANVETGTLYMANHRSNIIIAEFYGDVIETIGLSGLITPQI